MTTILVEKTPQERAVSLESLVKYCIKGDRTAQRQLYQHYRSTVYRLAYRALGPRFDIKDAVQLILIELFRSLPLYRGDCSFDTWVYRISVRVCSNQLRKKYRKRRVDIVYSDELPEHGSRDPYFDPGAGLEQKELTKTIYKALDKLDSDRRMVLIMYELEGKALEEIAEILGKPIGTVKSRLFRARKDLERHLRKYVNR